MTRATNIAVFPVEDHLLLFDGPTEGLAPAIGFTTHTTIGSSRTDFSVICATSVYKQRLSL